MLGTLILFTTLVWAEPNKITEDVKKLFAILLPGTSHHNQGQFKLDECPDYQIEWLQLALLKKSFTANYKFKPGCDIEGSFSPLMDQSFVVNLKIRNIADFETLKMNSLLKIIPEENKLKLSVSALPSEVQSPKNSVKFSGDYAISVTPLDFENYENLGGEIQILEINKKKINIKEKIFIK